MELSYLPGAASLIEQLDRKISIILRDGRNLVGVLRSFDQYMNLTVENTHERVIVGDKFADYPLGIYIVRGDNVVLLGEVDEERNARVLKRVEREELEELAAAAAALEATEGSSKRQVLWDFVE